MAYIKSRKHPAAPLPRVAGCTAALTAVALALPAAAQTQPQADTRPPAEQTLPEVKAKGKADAAPSIKADAPSSPKFAQPLLNTPQTITVIRQEVLQQQGAVTLSEALQNTPGITMLAGENGNTSTGDSIFMRGFDAQGSIFVDGIRDLGAISRDTFNIESVEVFKGPAGADVGRGSASGYVNLVTKAPQADTFNNARVSYASGKRVRATADLNRQLDSVLEGAAFRLNLMKQDGGVAGRDHVEKNGWAIAPSLAFGLGSPTRATFYYLHAEHDNRPDGGVSTIGLPGYANGALPSGAQPARADTGNYYGSLSDFENIKIDMFTARFEHDLKPGTTLANTSRFGRSEQRYELTGINSTLAGTNLDPSQWTVQRTRQGRLQQNDILTNQTHLKARFDTAGLKHTLSSGVEFIYERQNAPTYSIIGAATTTNASIYNPSVNDSFQAVLPNGAYSKGQTLTAAVYAFDTLEISKQWLINAGLRWEKFRTEFNSATYTAASNTVTQNAPQSVSDDLLSWKLGAVFKPADNGSIYVSAANNRQPPGGAALTLSTSGTNANNPAMQAQESTNLEVGTKWDLLGGKLAVTAAAFRSENRNEVVTDAVTNETTQVGERQVKGIELGVVGQLSPMWQVSAGLSRLDPEITRGTTNGNVTQGGVIQWTPKLAFTSWTTYKLPMGLTIGGGARFVDTVRRSNNVSFTTAPTGVLEVDDYWVFDAMAAYELSKNISLQLNVYNLADKKYVAALNNSGARYFPGKPRSAQISANFAY